MASALQLNDSYFPTFCHTTVHSLCAIGQSACYILADPTQHLGNNVRWVMAEVSSRPSARSGHYNKPHCSLRIPVLPGQERRDSIRSIRYKKSIAPCSYVSKQPPRLSADGNCKMPSRNAPVHGGMAVRRGLLPWRQRTKEFHARTSTYE